MVTQYSSIKKKKEEDKSSVKTKDNIMHLLKEKKRKNAAYNLVIPMHFYVHKKKSYELFFSFLLRSQRIFGLLKP